MRIKTGNRDKSEETSRRRRSGVDLPAGLWPIFPEDRQSLLTIESWQTRRFRLPSVDLVSPTSHLSLSFSPPPSFPFVGHELSPLPSLFRWHFASGRKIECEHGRSICPKESLIFGRCPPTILVLVENYISPWFRRREERGARDGGGPTRRSQEEVRGT